ncbi:hypothetical protein [Sinomonas atrocyanea]
MSGKHTTPAAGAEPTAWTPEDLHEAHELSEAVLHWDYRRRATLEDIARRPRLSFQDAVECHDTDGSAYILPRQLSEHRIAGMVEAATLILGPTEDELRTAVQAVTEAVTDTAARAVAQAHPDAAVQAEHALWGTPALRYDGTDQEQAALYERGIPSDHLLEGALAYTPGALIAAASIRAQRTAAAQNPEPARLEEEKTSALPAPGAEPELTAADIAQIRAQRTAAAQNPEPARLEEEKTSALAAPGAEPELTAADIAQIRAQRTAAAQNPEPARLEEEKTSGLPAPGAEPELTAADIAQIRALQAASFPTSPGTHQPTARTGAAAGTDPAATRAPTPATARGHGR